MKGKKVLLVEDNEINQEIMAEMLDALGFQVEVAEHGKSAVDKLATSVKGDFDVVLMDIHMPVMDGFEAAGVIRESTFPLRDIPIIAMTGECLGEDKRHATEVGMNGFIPKPASMGQILEVIERVLD